MESGEATNRQTGPQSPEVNEPEDNRRTAAVAAKGVEQVIQEESNEQTLEQERESTARLAVD